MVLESRLAALIEAGAVTTVHRPSRFDLSVPAQRDALDELVASGAVSADRVVRAVNRRGRGI